MFPRTRILGTRDLVPFLENTKPSPLPKDILRRQSLPFRMKSCSLIDHVAINRLYNHRKSFSFKIVLFSLRESSPGGAGVGEGKGKEPFSLSLPTPLPQPRA